MLQDRTNLDRYILVMLTVIGLSLSACQTGSGKKQLPRGPEVKTTFRMADDFKADVVKIKFYEQETCLEILTNPVDPLLSSNPIVGGGIPLTGQRVSIQFNGVFTRENGRYVCKIRFSLIPTKGKEYDVLYSLHGGGCTARPSILEKDSAGRVVKLPDYTVLTAKACK